LPLAIPANYSTSLTIRWHKGSKVVKQNLPATGKAIFHLSPLPTYCYVSSS